MTPDQQAELRATAHASEACAQALASRDIEELARILSAGRTRPSSLEVGNGTILDVLGIEAGNRLLDHIQVAPEFRHVKPLLDQGRLKIGAAPVQAALQSFATEALSHEDADKLCTLGRDPDPLTPHDVAAALYEPDGTPK